MSKVVSVEKHPKNAEWRVVTLDQPRESGFGQFVVFSGALADALVKGEPLPDGTTEESPKFDGALPSLRLPRKGGGGGWSNTKEGAEFRERSIRAHQVYEQERMDRRTALMQAVALVPAEEWKLYRPMAREMYEWLRESAGIVQTGQDRPGSMESDFQRGPSTGSQTGATGAPVAPTEPVGGGGHGEGAAASPGFHQTGKAGGYPLEPDLCDHKAASGRWLPTRQVEGQPVCPRCGLPTVLYRESGP